MKLLGHHYVLEAFELANAADRRSRRAASHDDDLTARPSREAIAAAWRSWAEQGRTGGLAESGSDPRVGRRRGLALSAPRSES